MGVDAVVSEVRGEDAVMGGEEGDEVLPVERGAGESMELGVVLVQRW